MKDSEELIRRLRKEYPIIPHTNAGRLSSTVRRMKAEKQQAIPINRRTGFAISTSSDQSASEMDEETWEKFYQGLCEELRQQYPELFESIFPTSSPT